MKRKHDFEKASTNLIFIIIFVFCLTTCKSPNVNLKGVHEVIDKIKSISYTEEAFAIKTDTRIPIGSSKIFVQSFTNPEDSFLGTSYMYSLGNDKSKPDKLYDGRYLVKLDWKNKAATINQITAETRNNISIPFYAKVKFLLQYLNNNPDNWESSAEKYIDSTKITINIPDKLVEYYKSFPYVKSEKGSFTNFELVVNNKTMLPFRLRSVTPKITYYEKCSDIKVSHHEQAKLSALSQIPKEFSREIPDEYRKVTLPSSEQNIFPAQDWTLMEVDGDTISLKRLKSKVLLLEFTGIGCGPCEEAVPFLKKLVNDYRSMDFEFISIETWSGNLSELQKYKKKNKLNYKYLIANSDVKTKYKIDAVPIFFIIDEKRMVIKYIIGYTPKLTDNQLTDQINKLL
jgi:thiol-disulfide isomerase/thioredoxin